MTEAATADRSATAGRTPLWQAALAFVLLTTLYAAVSIQQYNRMDSFVFDLGFFESIIRDYAHGHLPAAPAHRHHRRDAALQPGPGAARAVGAGLALADRRPGRAGGRSSPPGWSR